MNCVEKIKPILKEIIIKSQQKDNFRELDEFINDNCSEKEVMIVQALMYIGRDGNQTNKDSIDEIIEETIKNLGFIEKTIEISQMTSKKQFADYINNGLNILGI